MEHAFPQLFHSSHYIPLSYHHNKSTCFPSCGYYSIPGAKTPVSGKTKIILLTATGTMHPPEWSAIATCIFLDSDNRSDDQPVHMHMYRLIIAYVDRI